MASALLELQGAIVARLKSAGVAGGRIYDAVPAAAQFPYVSFGPADEVQADANCVEATEITLQIDAWSRETGFRQVSETAAAVRAALHWFEPSLTTNALVALEHRITRRLRDPDGITSHAVIEIVATIETP